MEQEDAKRRGRRNAVSVAVLALALALCPITCIDSTLEMGCYMDGPGIGMFSDSPASIAVFWVLFVGACSFALVAWQHVKGRWRRGVAIVAAIGLCAAFTALDSHRKLLALSWSHRCTAGDGRACSAAGKLYELGLGVHLDRARAAKLYRLGCENGYFRACSRLLEQVRGDANACSRIASECRAASTDDWTRKIACETESKACASRAPVSDTPKAAP